MYFTKRICFRSRGIAVAVVAAISLLANQGASAQSPNPSISISDNSVHIDRGALYSGLSYLTASGGTAPYTFTVSPSTPLPSGITVGSNGSLSGVTCGANGSYRLTVTATDAVGGYNTVTNAALIVNRAPANGCVLNFSPSSLPDGTQGTAYSQTLTASGGSGSVTYTLASGTLPAGLSLSSSGAITGTPTTVQTTTFTVYAADSSGATGTQTYTININAAGGLVVNPSSLPAGTQGTAYNQTVSATGGTGPYTFAVSSGSLPAGLSLNTNTGAITGTPTTAGASSFTIQATDSLAVTGSRAYTVNIGANNLTISPATLPAGTQNVPYSQTVAASGGTPGYLYSLSGGSLPAGLFLNSVTGVISGTPTGSGPSTFTVHVVDSNGSTGDRPYTVNIGTNLLTVNPSSLPSGTQGVAYNQTVSATGGTGPYTFSVTSGSLPAGLTLDPNTGAVSGTPTGSGSSSFTIQALDSVGNVGSRAYTVNIGTGSLTVNPATLPSGTQGTPYSQTVTATGGNGSYTYSLSSGSLPAGLSLNAGTGVISGTPTGSGSSTFTVRADDTNGNYGSRAYTVNIGTNVLTVNPSTLPSGTQGTPYNQTVSATGGTGPYTFSISSGSLPAGLSLNPSTGAVTGTPTGSGSSSFTVQALDSVGNVGSRAYTVNIGTNSLTVNPATLPSGTQGTSYSQTVTATGGNGSYTYSLSSGSLPAGLSLNAGTGVISGTPTGSGPSTFTVRADDTNGNYGTRAYTVNIGTASLTVNPATLPSGTQGTSYSQTVSATGGNGSYTYSLSSGSLPAGLSLNASTGVISGTPTGSGPSTFTVRADDTNGNYGSRAYTVNIGTNSLTVNPSTLPAGTQGVAYNQTVSATGGTTPYTFSISSGSLPAGLSLNASTGAISGTPTATGVSSFTVRALDPNGNTGSRAYNLTIGGNIITVGPPTLPPATRGTPYNQTITASGGTGPYTFTLTSGSLPPGLSLNASTGAITGTPTSTGNFTFTVQARDSRGNIGSRTYTIVSRSNPALDPEVQGLITSQVATSRRLAEGQLTNVMRRLEQLHQESDPCAVDIAIAVAQPRDPAAAVPPPNMRDAEIAQRTAAARMACERDRMWRPPFSVWASGAIEIGTSYLNGAPEKQSYSSQAVTGGIDWRITKQVAVGFAAGLGRDKSTVTNNGTNNAGTTIAALVYGSYRPFGGLYLDGLLGYGSLGFESRRWITDDGSFASGQRSGRYWVGSLAVGWEQRFGHAMVAPYLRGEYISVALKDFTEGGSNLALSYGSMSFDSRAVVLGLRGRYDFDLPWAKVSPNMRVEYKYALDSAFNQSMFYADLGPIATYDFTQGSASRSSLTTTLGLSVRPSGTVTFDTEYGFAIGSNSQQTHSLRGILRVGY